jgi:uncharacterized protein involved in exopolysaccharide biosynthesis
MRDINSIRLPQPEPLSVRGTKRPDGFAPVDVRADVPPPEAELLRVIERALQAQQRVSVCEPLVSRIETILGKKLEAANDPQPPSEALSCGDAIAVEILEDIPVRTKPTLAPVSGSVSPVRARWSVPLVAALCVVGAVSGMLIPTEPSRYRAQGVLAVAGAPDARPALVGAAKDALLSPRTIAGAVSALKLDHDPAFAGADAGAFNLAVDLLSASAAAIDPVSRAEASLAAAIQASSNAAAGTIDFAVTTGSADKSARIAAYLASAVGHNEPVASQDDAALTKASGSAEAELSAFTQQAGEGNVKVAIGLQRQITDADVALKAAEERMVAAKERADRLKTAKVADVVSGTLPADIVSPSLEDRRNRYVAAKSSLAQLAANLGPRHPRLIAQQAEADGLSGSISEELARLSRDSSDDAKSAALARRQLSDHRNALIAQSRDTGVDLAKLTELRDKAAAARARLEDGVSTAGMPAIGGRVALVGAPLVSAVSSGNGDLFAPSIGALAGLVFGLAAVWGRGRGESEAAAFSFATRPAEPPVDFPAPMPDKARPDDVGAIRSQIAAMRDRLQSHAAAF